MGQRRAVIYRRISQDATGEAAGVTRQAEDCARYCEQRGWDVVADLEDNDISASQYTQKKRPAYLEAIRLIETGAADALVAWHLDRLWRRPAELEHLIDLVEKTDAVVATLNGEIDLNSGDGRFQARILVSVAAKSSDDASRRLKRAMLQRAEAGTPHGHRPFGWQPGGLELHPVEAPIVREMVNRFVAGESAIGLARSLNERKILTPQSRGEWSAVVLRDFLLAPRLAGLRVHHGDVIGDGQWEPIITRAEHEHVKAAARARGRRALPPRRRLLTGLVRCGRCGCVLTYAMEGKLRCTKHPGDKNCGGLTIRGIPLEAVIVEAVFLRLDTPALARAGKKHPKSVGSELAGEIAGAEAKQAELAEMWASGELDRREWLAARRAIESRLEPLRREHARAASTMAVAPYAGKAGMLRAAWPSMDLDQQRTVLAAVIDRVVVAPATRRGPVFDPDRIDVIWRA